ncbi:hypothetical protein HJFPF1_10060 [Paramyrothecium foliicola]|nr:hypothetical protein HJFPF1_10060 [Paramyrothecium foliicola]
MVIVFEWSFMIVAYIVVAARVYIGFATKYLFHFGIYFLKFSIDAFYYIIIPITKPTMRKWLHALTGISTSASLFTLFPVTFGADRTYQSTGQLANFLHEQDLNLITIQ